MKLNVWEKTLILDEFINTVNLLQIVRNKVKRRIRESFRLDVDKKIKSGYDIVFIARVAISDMQYNEINKSMKHLVNKFKLFK